MAVDDLADWLTLGRVPGIGPKTFQVLLNHFGSAGNVLHASTQALTALGIKASLIEGLRCLDPRSTARELKWAEHAHHHILTLTDPRYPPQLREIAQAPPVLFVMGDVECLQALQVAIVGSRHPTPNGRDMAYQLAGELATTGFVVTSGLALGIDAQGHQGALDADGLTIAVAATGLDQVYPRSHHRLASQIIEHGAIVSEFGLGTPPRAEHFPRRNRIISGLSLGVIVVEAGLQSGSLITARYAVEQNREVFAVPGSVRNPLSRGCHHLIRSGAALIECTQDVLLELQGPLGVASPSTPLASLGQSSFDPEPQKVLDCLTQDPLSMDAIVERSGLTAETVSAILLMLELHGQVAQSPGGAYSRL